MPLFLRALPLSLVALWHYVFVLPLVLIVSVPFLLFMLLPLMALPVMVTITTFVTFAGYRCALAAHGKGSEPSFFRLIKSSLSWGVTNLVSGTVLMIAAYGIGRLFLTLGFSDTVKIPTIFAVPYAGGLAAAAYMVLITFYNALVAVPMTAAANAARTNGQDSDPFSGMGGGLFSLMIANFVWLSGLVYLDLLAVIVDSVAKGLLMVADEAFGVPLEQVITIDWLGLTLAIAYMMWGTCWFCATAILAWDRIMQRKAKGESVEVQSVAKASADELRALREARMPGNREQS